jgi:LacI family transcriptional regulator
VAAPFRKKRRVLFVTDFYLEGVLTGIVDYVREAGWELYANMRFHGRFPPGAEGCDGILATVQSERVRDWLAQRNEVPIVRMIDTPFDLPYPAVEADYTAAGRAGARHLRELGHVHFAFYTMFERTDIQEARAGFEAELAGAGQSAHRLDYTKEHPGCDSFEIGSEDRHRWLAKELKQLPKPLAVMTDDDRRGLELLAAASLAGLRVPEDVAILGCDDHWVEQRIAPIPLSSVDMNFRGVGFQAASVLDKLLRGQRGAAARIRVAPAGVVARRSTATFVTDSPGITEAVLYLREHFRKPLGLAHLAKRSGMSERMFELEFKRRVGHSAREELQRARLACAGRLLRDTDLKLEAIAMESGFGSAAKLCRFFGKTFGVSPNVWRSQGKSNPG